MNSQLNLKELERRAFRSTYQDGLWDVMMGLFVIGMAVFIFRPEEGYSAWNIILMVLFYSVANIIYWVGKKFITIPRMGQVSFGPMRKRKNITLAIIMGVIVVIQAGFVFLTTAGWLNAEIGAKISALLGGSPERLLVAAVGSLFVGPPMMVIAYFSDFTRGYYIALLMALAVFLMILLNQPIYPILIGLFIFVPGVVLFVRFLRKYPLHREEEEHE